MITYINEWKKYNTLTDNEIWTKEGTTYYKFYSDNYYYYAAFSKSDYSDMYYFGFRSRTFSQHDLEFDTITNDELYKLKTKLLLIIEDFKFKNNAKGLIFSTNSNKKGDQRVLLYKRWAKEMGWIVEYDDQNNQYKIFF